MIEKTLAVILMFHLNYLPRFWEDKDGKLKRRVYKLALLVYSLQSYLLALFGSTIAAYKVLSVSTPQTNDGSNPGAKPVVALMLLLMNNALRFYVGDFFLSKFFDENLDLLGSVKAQIKPLPHPEVPNGQAQQLEMQVVGANANGNEQEA